LSDSSPAGGTNALVVVIVGVGILWLTPLWLRLLTNFIIAAAPPFIVLWLVVMVVKRMIKSMLS